MSKNEQNQSSLGSIISTMVGIFRWVFCPLIFIGVFLYCIIAIPMAYICGGWVLSRDKFLK
jgi:hypothetical protein